MEMLKKGELTLAGQFEEFKKGQLGRNIHHSRKTTLVMSVSDRRKTFFDSLFQKIEEITPKMPFKLSRKFLMNYS